LIEDASQVVKEK